MHPWHKSTSSCKSTHEDKEMWNLTSKIKTQFLKLKAYYNEFHKVNIKLTAQFRLMRVIVSHKAQFGTFSIACVLWNMNAYMKQRKETQTFLKRTPAVYKIRTILQFFQTVYKIRTILQLFQTMFTNFLLIEISLTR